jgi:osmotically-inducible protein OsmY
MNPIARSALVIAIACLGLSACGAPKNVRQIESAAASNPASLQTRVENALRNAPNVHAAEIQVEVTGQVVTLRGDVHGQQEIDGAIAAARSVPGVQDVKSELKPKS